MASEKLPPIPTLRCIVERLPKIFPEGTPARGYLIREIAAKTIFVMFYTGAVEGYGRWLRPHQVTLMTTAQSRKTTVNGRETWTAESLKTRTMSIPNRWYADNTREPIRDETLKDGLIPVGAVIERQNLPTTSPQPRYALAADFAELFLCDDNAFAEAAVQWQVDHLGAGVMARLRLLREGITSTSGDSVIVGFPNGEQRRMSPGPSSVISKGVVEEFAPRFLEDPGVIFLSESQTKVVSRDDELARAIGLEIPAARLLPDIILVDLGPSTPLIVFVEVVATAGAVSPTRKNDLHRLLSGAGYPPDCARFVTALDDRGSSVFRKVATEVAWGTFIWCRTEPNCIINYRGEEQRGFLSDL